jgi:hypothetical protein
MTRFFYDTEFIDDGVTIDLISIGVVAEDDREFYAISTEFDPSKASPWVQENVLAKLPWDRRNDPDGPWMTKRMLSARVLDFLAPVVLTFEASEAVELWAYYAAYDHVAFAQLWGPMIYLPTGVPMFTNELMQLWESAGRPPKPPESADAHDALADARWNRELWLACQAVSA